MSRRNFSRDFKDELLKRQLAIKKRDRKVVEDLKLYEEKGFQRRLALPITEHASLFANSAQPIKRPKQVLKSSSWRDISCEFYNHSKKSCKRLIILFRFVLCEHT